MISVSKLCCPVCWELFKELGLSTEIRGCHPTVTPLVLPETLSPCITKRMVKNFQVHLASQLVPLLSVTSVGVSQHRRNESETGYSAASSNESASEFTECYRTWEEREAVTVQMPATHGA